MGIGVEIPIHEAIVFDFRAANADAFLKKHPARVLFVGQQLVKGLSVPPGFTCGRADTLFLQSGDNLAQTVAVEVTRKDPADNGGFVRIDDQFTIRASIVSVAPALDHFGGAVLGALSQAISNGLAFFDVLHRNLSFPKMKATVTKITVACWIYRLYI